MSGVASSVDSRTQVVDATGQIRLANANFFFMITATAAITVVFSRGGSSETYAAAQAGLQIGRVKPWDYAFITAAPGTSVTFFYGYANLREDVTDFRQAIATISGITPVSISPSATIADKPKVTTVAGQHALFAANVLRRRITVWSVPSNVGDTVIFFRTVAGANSIGFITAGLFIEFDTTAGLDYICTNGGDDLLLFEET